MEENNLYYKMIKNPRILIVDDSATNNLLIQSILVDQGYVAVIATNGKEALKYITEEEFDLILLDIMMPKMNGFEVLEKLKDNQIKSRVPVIVITAKVETNDVKKAIDLGAVDYIKKPIDIDEIISRTNMALRLKKISDESIHIMSINQKLINSLIKNFLSDHVDAIISGDDNRSELLKTIDSLVSIGLTEQAFFNTYLIEYSNVNIVDIVDKVLKVYVDTLRNKNINLERNYSGEILSKTDSNMLMYCFFCLFSHIFSQGNTNVVVSIYNSNEGNVIKIYDTSKVHNEKTMSTLSGFFSLLNIQFKTFDTSMTGKEYEIMIP